MIISANKWEHDVQGYLNICNITDTTPRKQIRDFAAGVNDLGLWDSMVCWPLRSAQNIGGSDPTSTTVFSLGGLGTYNGTRVNGPTWGADGIDFDGSNDHITTSFNPAFNNITVFAAANADTDTTRRMIVSQRGNSTSLSGYNIFSEGSAFGTIRSLTAEVYDTFWRGSAAGQIAVGNWTSAGMYWDKSFVTGFRDSQAGSATAALFTGSRNLMIGSNDGFWWDGKISAIVVVHNAGNVFASVRDLYKSTLGTGLGLP